MVASRVARVAFLSGLVVAATIACEQRFSAYPAPFDQEKPTPSSSAISLDALFAPAVADAGAVAQTSIPAMTVARCSSSIQLCSSEGDAAASENYRVAFGSGRGTIRSREQATADFFKELRDRTTSGQRLIAEMASRGDAGTAEIHGVPSAVKSEPSVGNETLLLLAVRLMDFVDSTGEISLDVIHESGSNGCILAVGRFAERRATQCLLEEHQKLVKPTGRGGFEF